MAVKSIKEKEDLTHVVKSTDLFPSVDQNGENPRSVTAAQIAGSAAPDIGQNQPVWRIIPVQNWETGEVISFALADYVISPDDSALSFVLTSGELPGGLTSNSAARGRAGNERYTAPQSLLHVLHDSARNRNTARPLARGYPRSEPAWG